MAIPSLLTGLLADRFNKRWLVFIGALLLTLLSWPMYAVIHNQSLVFVCLSLAVLCLSYSLLAGSFGALIAELFPARTRYTGIAFSYNLAFALVGGTTPLIATALIKTTQLSTSPAIYLSVIALVVTLSCFSWKR